ncbi:MAG: WecB/TagA/CpsF family glycosyltransferase [Cyanobacteria bacterium P01_F01_bin.53]
MIQLAKTLNAKKFKKTLPTQHVVGFPISTLSFDAHVDTMARWAKARLSKVVCVSNVHMMMEGNWKPEFSKVLTNADLLTPDGMPLVWMTSLLSGRRHQRVAGMELLLGLCEKAQAQNISIFFLGSTPNTLVKIREKLSSDFPNLRVVGMYSPPFRKLSAEENKAIVDKINASGAGFVFVALGCPKQEYWMHRNREQVRSVMVGLGGAFAVYAGVQRWAPVWVRENGLEWLYRLIQEPRRLWKRYFMTIPTFIWLALIQVVKVRLGLDPNKSVRQNWLGRFQ